MVAAEFYAAELAPRRCGATHQGQTRAFIVRLRAVCWDQLLPEGLTAVLVMLFLCFFPSYRRLGCTIR